MCRFLSGVRISLVLMFFETTKVATYLFSSLTHLVCPRNMYLLHSVEREKNTEKQEKNPQTDMLHSVQTDMPWALFDIPVRDGDGLAWK